MNMAMLEIEKVSTFYGEFQALHEVSFKVDEKKLAGIVGANGAGKSTLLRTIAGLTPARSGSICFRGVSIERLPTFEIAKLGIALVPEGRRLFPYMSVFDNLLLGAFLWPDKRKREKTLQLIFEFFPILKERKRQLAGTLSGGQQQMLAIGRALMGNPEIIMLDEPSLGLSPKMVSQIYRILDRIKEMGITIVLVEQNVESCLRKAEEAYIFENGSIVLEGAGSDLLKKEEVRKAYLGL
jgi:branched-chain amino acid transport system ATP-binding protein